MVMSTEAIAKKLQTLGYEAIGIGQPELDKLLFDLQNLPIVDVELQEPWNLCIVLARPLTAREAWNLARKLYAAGDADYIEDGPAPYVIIDWDRA